MDGFGRFDEKDGYYYGRSKYSHIRYAGCDEVSAAKGRERDRQREKETFARFSWFPIKFN